MKNIRLFSARFARRSIVNKATKKNIFLFKAKTKYETFHESVKFILRVAQYFTIMPISGIQSANIYDLEISRLRTFATVTIIGLASIELGLACNHAVNFHFHFTSVANIMYIVESTMAAILLLFMSRRWKNFMIQWRTLENCFLHEPYEMEGTSLKKLIQKTGSIYFAMMLIEHLLVMLSSIIYDYQQYSTCKFPTTTFINFYFVKERPHIFLYVPFNVLAVVPVYWLLVCLVFAWSFVDLFLIVISIGLAKRFKQFHTRLLKLHLTVAEPKLWTDLRYHFASLLDLLFLIDEEISYLILLSCGSNLFSICFQIFNSLKAQPHILRKITFWFSFLCLILRTFIILYAVAAVHEVSRNILDVLRDVPSKNWNIDIQFMMDLFKGKPIALTGGKFFIITRRLILAMTATIITYEFVLMDEAQYNVEDNPICNTTRLTYIKNNY